MPDRSKSNRRPTLADVAAEVGAGKSTVARALRGDRHVSQKTAEAVRVAAKKLGYRPDPILSSLARDHWRARNNYTGVSVAMIGYDAGLRRSAALAAEYEGARRSGAARGYSVDLIDAAEFQSCRRLGKMLFTRAYRGLILGPMNCPDDWLRIDWDQYAVVSYGVGYCQPPADWVALDFFGMMQEAWSRVRESGYRRIGFVLLRDRPTRDHDEMLAAFRLAQERDGAARSLVPLHVNGFSAPAEFLEWFSKNRPDAVIASGPVVYRWLIEAELKVPGEVGFVGLGVDPGTGNEGITGASARSELIGSRAMELLDHLVCGGTRGLPLHANRITLATEWLPGQTLGNGGRLVASRRAKCRDSIG